jgi:hypothetical protein
MFIVRVGKGAISRRAHGACHRARIRATRWLENALAHQRHADEIAIAPDQAASADIAEIVKGNIAFANVANPLLEP